MQTLLEKSSAPASTWISFGVEDLLTKTRIPHESAHH
jgi:hypothetical protein